MLARGKGYAIPALFAHSLRKKARIVHISVFKVGCSRKRKRAHKDVAIYDISFVLNAPFCFPRGTYRCHIVKVPKTHAMASMLQHAGEYISRHSFSSCPFHSFVPDNKGGVMLCGVGPLNPL